MKNLPYKVKKILAYIFPCFRKKSKYTRFNFEEDTYSEAFSEVVEKNYKADKSIALTLSIRSKMRNGLPLSDVELKHIGIVQIG
tara:strand:+ start:73 stop:324 length:252 start_codon:yes stop_codon:yes gene_type:complete